MREAPPHTHTHTHTIMQEKTSSRIEKLLIRGKLISGLRSGGPGSGGLGASDRESPRPSSPPCVCVYIYTYI